MCNENKLRQINRTRIAFCISIRLHFVGKFRSIRNKDAWIIICDVNREVMYALAMVYVYVYTTPMSECLKLD